MGANFQIHRASVDMARGFRQFQKADDYFIKDNEESAEKHLSRGLDLFQKSFQHLSNAADDLCIKAGNEIDKGNNELQKSIDDYSDGNDDSAVNHYVKALDHYDQALDYFEVD